MNNDLSPESDAPDPYGDSISAPFAWRIRFEMAADRRVQVEIDLTAPLTLGIAPDSADTLDLSVYGAVNLGVSRAHARLDASPSAVCVTDLGSTNGTTLNGKRLTQELPTPLRHGDHLMLGDLAFVVLVIDTPGDVLEHLREAAESSDALIQMARTIPALVEMDGILQEAFYQAMGITPAGAISAWLVEEGSNNLVLAAERILDGECAIQNAERELARERSLTEVSPFAIWCGAEGNGTRPADQSHAVSMLYIPMIRGNETLGVFEIAHRDAGESFSPRDEKALNLMADLAAIAIQNVRQYQAIQQRDQQKADMMQNIGHEFRSPLQYISGYASMILEENRNTNRLTETDEQGLAVILQQTKKLTTLASNFVLYRTASEMAELRKATDLAEIVMAATAAAGLEAEKKQIDLHAENDPNMPLAWVNAMAIHQVLDNLIGNALKFTPTGGRITVRAQGADGTGELEVKVEDTGIGIAAVDQEFIFDRFAQASQSKASSMGGVGLGLAVCKEIVEAHGGKITVTSEPGQGATLRFTIPAAPG